MIQREPGPPHKRKRQTRLAKSGLSRFSSMTRRSAIALSRTNVNISPVRPAVKQQAITPHHDR
jgi:hypothetical protein